MKKVFLKNFALSASVISCSFLLLSCNDNTSSDLSSKIAEVEDSYSKLETIWDGKSEKVETIWDGKSEIEKTVANAELQKQIEIKSSQQFAESKKRFESSRVLAGNNDVGVIPGTASCPSWSELLYIHMDNEDGSNSSSSGGWTGAWTNDGNSNMYFCRVDGRMFNVIIGTPQLNNWAYGVLALGATRPDRFAHTLKLFIDNEDGSNSNSSSGNLEYNSAAGNTTLFIHYYHPAAEGTPVNNAQGLGPVQDISNFGVFSAYAGNPSTNHGYLISDDENHNNANKLRGVSGVPYNGSVVELPSSDPMASPYRMQDAGISQNSDITRFELRKWL